LHMTTFTTTYLASSEAASMLGIHPMAIQKLLREGKLPAEKIANRWLLRRTDVEEFAKTYVPKVGRPRQKRKYTRRAK
jgi:excisionase family DNA binding protein